MKTTSITLAILLSTLSLISCDDEESGSNLPPDLRMEDVVGCWWWSVEDYCSIQCYDINKLQWYQTNDSITGRIFETVGQFELSGFYTVEHVKLVSSTSSLGVDTETIESAYKRVGNSLYTLDSRNELGDRFDPVNLDSALPCGHPFALLPKPANWTLF